MRTECYLTFALWIGMTALSLPAVTGAEQSLAGEQASWVTVEPRPTPVLPEGPTGIAARYPGDVGIEHDPDVVFVETFEGSLDEIYSRWESVGGRQIASVSDEVVPGSGLVGFWPPTSWPQGRAGQRPQGDSRWTTQIEPGDLSSWFFYTYWQGMGGSPPRGQTWGNTFEIGVPDRPVALDRWICLEVMVKMNDVGESNGEQACWLDGKLSRDAEGRVTSYLGKGFPSAERFPALWR